MATECISDLFGFASLERRRVEASFAAVRSARMVEGCCWARPTERSGLSIGLPSASGTAGGRDWWNTRSGRWLGSVCLAWRWATRISTITTGFGTIR
jgi:hypothetical protein